MSDRLYDTKDVVDQRVLDENKKLKASLQSTRELLVVLTGVISALVIMLSFALLRSSDIADSAKAQLQRAQEERYKIVYDLDQCTLYLEGYQMVVDLYQSADSSHEHQYITIDGSRRIH